MNLMISNSSGQPIYEQICTQIKQLIQSGSLAADEALPSIRLLAKDLRISVITTKRAYEELEREGYIYTVPGKGSFASGSMDADAARRKELLTRVRELVTELRYLGVTDEELLAILKEEDKT